MSEVKWIKIATNIFDDEKIRMIEAMPEGDAILVIWFKILALAGKVNDGGLIYFTTDIPYTDQMLSAYFNKPVNIIQLALGTFLKFEMIEIVDNVIYVSNWEKHQNIDALEKIREQNRLRKQKERERKRIESECHVTCHVTSQQCHATEEDIDIEEDIKRKDISKDISKRKKFTPPTVEEVKAYCEERKNGIDAEYFVDFYQSKNWMVGKNKMKDWKACVRTWERNNNLRKGDSHERNDSGQAEPVVEFTEEQLQAARDDLSGVSRGGLFD